MITITRETTTDEITAHLGERGTSYRETTEGAIRCELSGGRSLLIYQHGLQDGADIAGLWAWCETASDGEQCSGGLDSFAELEGLVA